jgi:hypothetical protein
MRIIVSWTFAVACVLALVSPGGAQTPYNPYPLRSPADLTNQGANLSPYLNLLRPGSPSANYYLGVVPEMQRRAYTESSLNDISSLFRATGRQQAQVEDLFGATAVLPKNPPTGHPVGFLNYGPYFSTLNRR